MHFHAVLARHFLKILGVLAIALLCSASFSSSARPSLLNRLKAAVESVSARTGGDPTTSGATHRTVDTFAGKNWIDPTYTPSLLDGARHLRTGGAGVDQFNNMVSGVTTCDMLLLFYAMSRVAPSSESIDECALLEYELEKERAKERKADMQDPGTRRHILEAYRPKVMARMDELAGSDKFWFRPTQQVPIKKYRRDEGALLVQMHFRPWGIDPKSNGDGFSGPGWTTRPIDNLTFKPKQVLREDMALWEVNIQMSPEDGEWFQRAQAGGPDNRLYFRVRGARRVDLRNGRHLNMMDIEIYRLRLEMRGMYNFSASRLLEFSDE